MFRYTPKSISMSDHRIVFYPWYGLKSSTTKQIFVEIIFVSERTIYLYNATRNLHINTMTNKKKPTIWIIEQTITYNYVKIITKYTNIITISYTTLSSLSYNFNLCPHWFVLNAENIRKLIYTFCFWYSVYVRIQKIWS